VEKQVEEEVEEEVDPEAHLAVFRWMCQLTFMILSLAELLT